MVKKINVRSNNQGGGFTIGVINLASPKKNKKKYSIIAVSMLILMVLTFFGVDKMFGKDKTPSAEYHVESNNQSGGITVGKIDNVNILTDKESLGIREPNGLYQNGGKVGTVINFRADDSLGTFTISIIEFDNPLRDANVVWQPYEYGKYTIQIKNINHLVTMMPPGAREVSGIILSKK
ncbi:MAG: hypothetical protein KKF50_02165 [Nanoarchaeota archaeon]|nr:hypothetical protein [Nanoarchaeota archaeon]